MGSRESAASFSDGAWVRAGEKAKRWPAMLHFSAEYKKFENFQEQQQKRDQPAH